MSDDRPKILKVFEDLETVLKLYVRHLQSHAESMVESQKQINAHAQNVDAFGRQSVDITHGMFAAAAFSGWVLGIK